MTAAGQMMPERVHPPLPAEGAWATAGDVFQQQKTPARGQHPVHFAGGQIGLWNGAEHQAGDHGVEVAVRVGQPAGVALQQVQRLADAGFPRVAAGQRQHRRLRLQAVDLADGVAVEGQIGAGADAQLQHAAAGALQQALAVAVERTGGPVQQLRKQTVLVPAHGAPCRGGYCRSGST